MARGRLCRQSLNAVATLLAVTLATGCAHLAGPLSPRITVPPLSSLSKFGVHGGRTAAARRAQNNIDRVLKQLKNNARRAHSPGGATDATDSLLGSGPEHAASTTGTIPESSPSSSGSTVVVTRPPDAALLSGNSPSGAATRDGAIDRGRTSRHEKVAALLVASGLIIAILWLPQRLDAQRGAA